MTKKKQEYVAVGTTDRSDETTTPLAAAADDDDSRKKASLASKATSALYSFIPILYWLPRYKWKDWIHGDIIAGLTVGIMHVPQGMAYASLASVPPVVGMYSSFFTSFAYMFFGTSRHISIGVFAVASMMTGACRLRFIKHRDNFGNVINGTEIDEIGDIEPVVLTSALALAVGVAQFLMGVFRLGFLTTYLSDVLVSGFTTGAAAHVFMSQLNKVFGISYARYEGPGMLVFMLRDIIMEIPKTNFIVLCISLFGLAFLHLGREYLNPQVKKVSKIPVPLELLLVIIGVIVSYFFDLKTHGVKIVNKIDKGFPVPTLPRVDLVPKLLPDAIPIAVVCYMFVVSMGKLFAKKHKYTLDSTQEFLATGIMHLFASFFPVYPVGASLSRSAVCEMSGAKTMLYVVFSSTLLLTVILFLGPFLEPLPMCILACIVMISLKSLFEQAKILPYLWKVSKLEFAVWMVSCWATVLTDVTTGLIISVVFNIMSIVLNEQWPKTNTSSTTDLSLQAKHVDSPALFEDSFKVFRFLSPLHFLNVTSFTDDVSKLLLNPKVSGVIVDCTAVTYVDTMGLDALEELYKDNKAQHEKPLIFAGFNKYVRDVMQRINFYAKVPELHFDESVPEALNRIGAYPE